LRGVALTRIHLEEDTARSVHHNDTSVVDFNRAGIPLMELVTEPVIHDAETAVLFAKELKLLLQYLGAGEANLEKGEMRIEANISIAKKEGELGTKVEVKNLNSFKSVEQAIAYEIKRHTELLQKGEKILQETRGWDEEKQKTFSQRVKEESHDYRYYPDPDLPKLYLSEIPECDSKKIRESLPVLPWDIREQYEKEGMKTQTIELLVNNRALNNFYSTVKTQLQKEAEHILAANYITSDLLGTITKPAYAGIAIEAMDTKMFARLIELVSTNTVSSRGAKEILSVWVTEGGDPEKIGKKLQVMQISDASALESVIKEILNDNASVVEDYKNGKESALQYLIGQGMKATKGAANPALLQELIKKTISRDK
jgi:aspartyl-tRNA(Asn)/glutamyl-tRNA(Gln) amidotransferase subunit B